MNTIKSGYENDQCTVKLKSRKADMKIKMMGKIIIILCLPLFYLSANGVQADQLRVADFSKSSLEGWKDKTFKGTTSYQLVQLKEKKVLMAKSQDSASGLVKKMRVDLKKYPYLNWSWSIENRLEIKNEQTKPGDDYAARIYVVVDGGILIWRTRAVNYVWANDATKGEIWPNAFAGKNAMMIALKSRQDKTSTWYSEKRNVYEDLKSLFGTEFRFIDAIALMTDTDNSHGQVKSYYGDIYFSTE